MIIIFTGPPFAGKDTQAKLVAKELNIPVYSMGNLIREAYDAGDPKAVEGYEKYSLKGLHLPIDLKFDLLKDKIEALSTGIIIDNFPANQEDLDAFNKYLSEKGLIVDKVIYITINEEEMQKRYVHRGRGDDDPEIVLKRRRNQDADRVAILDFYKAQGNLVEIDGVGDIDEIHKKIMEAIND